KIGETKFSMFYYQYPLLDTKVMFEGVSLASLRDIAAMKIHALESRGTRRDFVDVYILSQHFTLDQMLDLYQQKYAALEDHLYPILRSLTYFEDAEQEKQMPDMLIPLDWQEVKAFFQKETRRLESERLRI
ncbi:MAG: nucleotidyl transferase AbiEii/AbiGii toxin family protein, partial [Acidobacteriota bacterium]